MKDTTPKGKHHVKKPQHAASHATCGDTCGCRPKRHFAGHWDWPLSVQERVDLARRHFALSLKYKGEPRGVYEMRRHLSCYFKGLPDFRQTRMHLVTTTDPDEIYRTLDLIAEKWAGAELPGASNVYEV